MTLIRNVSTFVAVSFLLLLGMTNADITFKVSHTQETQVLMKSPQGPDALLHLLPPLFAKSCSAILKETPAEKGIAETLFSNGFVSAAFKAYSNHHHLVISPDDVWIAITTALSRYINNHAEEMRGVFVSHEGKEELVVYGAGSISTADYDGLIKRISILIEEKTKEDIRQWVEPNFSTTTPLIRTVGRIVLMGAMKNYFSYKMVLSCGLPAVTLQGIKEDWERIRHRADRLLTYNQPELTSWHQVLAPVLDQFVKSFSGEVDKDFWNRIVNMKGGGSGPNYISGWILAFVPWNDENEYILRSQENIAKDNNYGQLDTNDVPTSAVSVPVIIDDNGAIYNTTFYAGHLYSTLGDTPTSIRSHLGWVITDDSRRDDNHSYDKYFDLLLEQPTESSAYGEENYFGLQDQIILINSGPVFSKVNASFRLMATSEDNSSSFPPQAQ